MTHRCNKTLLPLVNEKCVNIWLTTPAEHPAALWAEGVCEPATCQLSACCRLFFPCLFTCEPKTHRRGFPGRWYDAGLLSTGVWSPFVYLKSCKSFFLPSTVHSSSSKHPFFSYEFTWKFLKGRNKTAESFKEASNFSLCKHCRQTIRSPASCITEHHALQDRGPHRFPSCHNYLT